MDYLGDELRGGLGSQSQGEFMAHGDLGRPDGNRRRGRKQNLLEQRDRWTGRRLHAVDPLVERGEFDVVLADERRRAQPTAAVEGEKLLTLRARVAPSAAGLGRCHSPRLPRRRRRWEDVLRLPLTLIQGFNEDSNKKYDELETDAEDAFVLALLQEK